MVEPLHVIFPGLANTSFRVTSAATRDYNCIAWAAGETNRWWWPDPDIDNEAVYWPPNVPREETVEAFVAAFAVVGYEPCVGEEFEPGFEKVALFAKENHPEHAARQLPSGRWTSKLGFLEDIEHDLHAVSGAEYGLIVRIMRRSISDPS